MERSSKQQLQDELSEMYKDLTDSGRIEERQQKEKREERVKEIKDDFGL